MSHSSKAPPEAFTVTYAFNSISFPDTCTPSHTPQFGHSSYLSVPHTLRGSETCYSSFQDGVEGFPFNNCVGSIVEDSIAYSTYQDTAVAALSVASNLSHKDLILPNEEGLKLLGIFMKNSPEWIVSEQAAYANDAAVVPLYSTLGATAIEFILEQTQLTTVVCTSTELKQLLELKRRSPNLALKNVVLCGVPVPTPLPETSLAIHSLSDFKTQPFPGFSPSPPSATSLATICYTSGTTGDPKGVLLTHSNFVAVASACLEGVINLTETDVHYSYLPLAHIFERTMQVGLYKCGSSVVFGSGDVKNLQKELMLVKPTIFIAVPRVLQKFHDGVMSQVKKADAMKQNVFNMALGQKLEALKVNQLSHPQWDGMVFGSVKAKIGLENVRFVLTGGASISGERQLVSLVKYRS